jgi:hypothetical protein
MDRQGDRTGEQREREYGSPHEKNFSDFSHTDMTSALVG